MTTLITGAAGRVGAIVRDTLSDRPTLYADRRVGDGDPRWRIGDLEDPDFRASVLTGVDTVVHLAVSCHPEASLEQCTADQLLSARLIDEAAEAGVRRIVYASSVHASGLYNRAEHWPVDPAWPPAPCCEYGAMKAAVEAHLRLTAARAGVEAVAVRLGLTGHGRGTPDDTGVMLTDRDARALFRAVCDAPIPQFTVCFATSANSAGHWNLATARRLGFEPLDDSASIPAARDPDPVPGRCLLNHPLKEVA